MKSLDERLLALEATPRVREAMTAAGLAPPVPPTKPSNAEVRVLTLANGDPQAEEPYSQVR
jgi:hypothetical protein